MNLMTGFSKLMQSETLAWRHLRAEEVEALPVGIRATLGASEEDSEWIVLRAGDHELGKTVDRAMRLVAMLSASGQDQGKDLGQLLEMLMERMPQVGTEADLWIDNLQLRTDYLRETPTLSAADVHRWSGRTSGNPSEPASRWKKEKNIFAVRQGRSDRYPAFQFRDGVPHPALKGVLTALPAELTGWQTALWFASANGWLDGDAPQERLDDSEQVLAAARRLAEPARG